MRSVSPRSYTAGRLLGHRLRETTAVYAHLDDGALRDTAAQAAAVIAHAMGYSAVPPPVLGEPKHREVLTAAPGLSGSAEPTEPKRERTVPHDPLQNKTVAFVPVNFLRYTFSHEGTGNQTRYPAVPRLRRRVARSASRPCRRLTARSTWASALF